MSITVSNCVEICNSPTNSSKAKMLYTFKKESRFPKRLRVLCDKFYNLPGQSCRTTSLGFGTKYDFTKDVPKCPPPNTYQIKSEFQTNGKKGVGFGEGRQEMQITGPFVSSLKNKNPGPGNYEMQTTLNKTCFSMSGKNYTEDKQKLLVPGPGAYQSSFDLSPIGNYFLAKHKNSCVRNFNNFEKRGVTIHTLAPGPGKYDTSKQQMSPQGRYYLSKMQNSLVRKFGSSIRQPLNPKSSTPGPGCYRIPSEFGYYQSKYKLHSKHVDKENTADP